MHDAKILIIAFQENPKFAVYVFIHGGVFQYGSGGIDEFGPDFIVSRNVVVVTMNYRIGVLGNRIMHDSVRKNVVCKTLQ